MQKNSVLSVAVSSVCLEDHTRERCRKLNLSMLALIEVLISAKQASNFFATSDQVVIYVCMYVSHYISGLAELCLSVLVTLTEIKLMDTVLPEKLYHL